MLEYEETAIRTDFGRFRLGSVRRLAQFGTRSQQQHRVGHVLNLRRDIILRLITLVLVIAPVFVRVKKLETIVSFVREVTSAILIFQERPIWLLPNEVQQMMTIVLVVEHYAKSILILF